MSYRGCSVVKCGTENEVEEMVVADIEAVAMLCAVTRF